MRLEVNQGPGAAFRTGFDAALEHAEPDALIVTLEADTTSDLGALPQMLDEVHRGADVVLADWQMVGVSAHRRLLSAGAGWVVRKGLGLEATTVSSFFRVYRASTLREASRRYGEHLIRERGFACKAELLAKLASMGARIVEVPVSLDWSRRNGESKMPVFKTMLAYWRMLFRERSGAPEPVPAPSDGVASRMRPSVGIVGGGILGMTAAYRLAQAGVAVSLYERAPDLGGLVGSFDFDGTPVDRFYHVVLPSDDRIVGLADELGLGDRWRFRPTKVGFYGDGRLFSMTSPKEFLTFPLLKPARARAARGLRRALPADQGSRRARRRAARRMAAAPLRARRRREALEAAARLQVRRPLRGPARDLHLGPDPPDGLDSRQERSRGDGLARRRLPDTHRRPRAQDRRPRAAR